MDWHGYTAFQEAQRNYLEHYGVKGMRWRNRKGTNISGAIQTATSHIQQVSGGNTVTSNQHEHDQQHTQQQHEYTVAIHEQLHPTSTYKEAKKSKRFSFFASILAKMKKLFGK